MNKKYRLLILVVTVLSLLVACGSDDVVDGENEKTEKTKVTLIVRTNLGDKSFNDSAWEGTKKAGEDLDMEVNVIEIGGDQAKYEPTLIDVSESDADVILVNSGAMSELAEDIVGLYPEKRYVFFDMDPIFENTYDNVIALSYKQNESSYLAGALGALMSETGELGFIGGSENLVINDFMVGYIEGAKHINEDIKVHTSMVGNFTDTSKSKELAFVQMDSGADVIHPVAGAAGLGALDAVKERNMWALGVDSDQAMMLSESAPETAEVILTSALKNVNVSLYNILEEYNKGTIEWGTTLKMGIKEGVAGIAKNDYYNKNVSEDVKLKLEEIEEQIKSGEILVPTAFELTQQEVNELKNLVKP